MADIQTYLNKIKTAVLGKEVRQSIHDGIKQCYYDGKAGAIDLDARERAAAAEARMDLFTTLPNASMNTIGDAELIDIRVGLDGTKYANAGTAVREQLRNTNTIEVKDKEPTKENTQMWIRPSESDTFCIPEIKDDDVNTDDTWSSQSIYSLFATTKGECGNLTEKYEKTAILENLITNDKGELIENSTMNTYGFVAECSFDIWVTDIPVGSDGSPLHLAISLFKNGDPTNPDNFKVRHRHDGKPYPLPTVDSKLHVAAGDFVAINAYGNTYDLCTSYPLLGYKANPNMTLAEEQIDQIEKSLDIDILFDKSLFTEMTDKFDGFTFMPNININERGELVDSLGNNDTYCFEALSDFTIYATSHTLSYLAITLCSGTMDDLKYITRYRYKKSSGEDTLPKEDSPLLVTKGTLFFVTVSINKGFSFMTNYSKCGLYLSDKVKIKNVEESGLTVKYENISNTHQEFTIFKLTGCGKYHLGVTFIRKAISDKNSNIWKLGPVKIYDLNYEPTNHETVVLDGEWECAIKENGKSDFMGGAAHGDESVLEGFAFLDGKKLDLSSDFMTTGERFEFYCCSELYEVEPIIPSTMPVCMHYKKYTITSDVIVVDQTVHFLEDMSLEPSYVSMFPISRYYTPRAWRLGSGFEDISADDHVQARTDGNKHKVFMWGDVLTATVEIDCDSKHAGNLYISGSDSPAYNKIYYSFVGYGDDITIDEVVNVTTKYTIDMSL